MTASVAAYLRVSTEEQAEQGISIPAQKARITAYCQAQGWNLYNFYIDDGYSGKNLDRPAMQKLIADAKDQAFAAIVVIKLDRLSRRQKDVLYLIEDVFEPNHVGFKSVSEPFDTTTPFGKAAIGMMAVFAQLERETIIERVKEAKKEAARQGRFMGGPVPYGYKHIPGGKSVDIDDLESQTLRFIFDEYLTSGKGYQYIADCLNARGIRPPNTAREWNRSTVRFILHNSFYAGYIEHKGKLHKGKHPPIISDEQFLAAQKIQSVRSSYDSSQQSGLLTGLLYCAECGARMRLKRVWKNPRNHKEKVAYYICYSQDQGSKSMTKDTNCRCGYKRAIELDKAVIEELHRYSYNQNILKDVADKLLQPFNKAYINRAINQAQKELDGIQRKLDKWYEAFEQETITANDLIDRIKGLRDRRTYLENQLSEYQAIIKKNRTEAASTQEIISMLTSFDTIWNHSTDEERRKVLLNLISSIYVSKDDSIEIIFT